MIQITIAVPPEQFGSQLLRFPERFGFRSLRLLKMRRTYESNRVALYRKDVEIQAFSALWTSKRPGWPGQPSTQLQFLVILTNNSPHLDSNSLALSQL